MPDDNDYEVIYGFGYAKYRHISNEIEQELKVFVPLEDSLKVNLLVLKNLSPRKKSFKIVYYIKPVLGEDEIKSNGYIETKLKKNSNTIILKNKIQETKNSSQETKNNIKEIKENEEYSYISCNNEIKSYTGDRRFFFGSGNIKDPEALKRVSLNNKDGFGEEQIVAIQIEIELEAFENKTISFILGTEKDKITCLDKAYQYSNIQKCETELEKIKNYWNNFTNKIQVQTPIQSFNILLNGWLAYQTLACRLWARTGFYQSGGAFGFRDQLQDTLGLKFYDTDIMKKQILKHASCQFIEGDVEHWWHEDNNMGIRTRFTDDLLWLPYTVCEYIIQTGDYSILNEEVEYAQGDMLENGINERYDVYKKTDFKENLYKHCIRAIEKSINNFGKHGLPKIGSGDWNDGMSSVGSKGNGESIWLGFFLYDVLNKFTSIIEKSDSLSIINIALIDKYKQIQDKLKKALNSDGWDGRWYKRAYTDDGDELGSLKNEECKIDSISQSWAVISGAGDNDKKYISMESLENHLVDKENGIIKLLDPPFEKSKLEPGYIKAYIPGTRENGGQYTHGAIWTIVAECMLGFGDKAVELFRMINPVEHSKTKEEANKYKVEPYVMAADVYSHKNLAGRGGWTWYTGSSSWMLKTGIEYILGLKIENNYLRIEPCIDSKWNEYSIRYKYGTSIYNIKVKNPNSKNTGVDSFILNGNEIQEKCVKLIDDGKVNNIEIIM